MELTDHELQVLFRYFQLQGLLLVLDTLGKGNPIMFPATTDLIKKFMLEFNGVIREAKKIIKEKKLSQINFNPSMRKP